MLGVVAELAATPFFADRGETIAACGDLNQIGICFDKVRNLGKGLYAKICGKQEFWPGSAFIKPNRAEPGTPRSFDVADRVVSNEPVLVSRT
jgi:hypothetical protein